MRGFSPFGILIYYIVKPLNDPPLLRFCYNQSAVVGHFKLMTQHK